MNIKVTNDAGNIINEIPKSMLSFWERAGYHKIEEPVEIPASEPANEGGDLSSEVKQDEVSEKELTKREKAALAKAEKEAAKVAEKEGK